MMSFQKVIVTCLAITSAVIGQLQAVPVMFGVTFEDQLISIDPATGTISVIAPLDSHMFPTDLAVRGGRLYTYDQVAFLVRQIDPFTGHTVASIDIGDCAIEGAVAFRSDGIGFLSAVQDSVWRLYRFDLSGPSSTLIGATDIALDGLAFDENGTLYGLTQNVGSQNGTELYVVDPTSAASTLVGVTGIPRGTSSTAGLTFGPDGTMYAALGNAELGSPTHSSLYVIDKETGAATLRGNMGSPFSVSGIAFAEIAAIPEPSTALLLACGSAALVCISRVRFTKPKHATTDR